MGDRTGIEWTDATWNPVSGCTKVSQGCKHCYAERVFPRPYPGRKFTDVRTHAERLDQPFRWRKPRRIFVNSMSDAKHHTFQVLTKRPQRMWEFMTGQSDDPSEPTRVEMIRGQAFMAGYSATPEDDIHWPLPNVWLGVSVEDQATADERIPLLLQTPAAVRFLSCEPLLGPLMLEEYLCEYPEDEDGAPYPGRLHGVIAGGESGPMARPAHPNWFRSLRDQCVASGVPFFFKQWGEWGLAQPFGFGKRIIIGGNGHARSDGAESLYDDDFIMEKFGKKRAGRELDGRTWDELPAIRVYP